MIWKRVVRSTSALRRLSLSLVVRRIERIMARQIQACPKCGGTGLQRVCALKSHFNIWLFLLGGWIISLLWGLSHKEEVRCLQCEAVFSYVSRGSIVARVLLVLLLVLIVLGFWAMISEDRL